MSPRRWPLAVFMLWLVLSVGLGSLAPSAGAEGFSDDGGAEWRVEQPQPPPPPVGVEASTIPIGLGKIGDIEFSAPNRGALITAGNGSTVSPGVWLYNGERWREIATVCGATDGRIAWASSGADEFWTISDGRPGQATEGDRRPPLEDDTLCHFAPGPTTHKLEVVASYALPAFQSNSYQAMHAAACIEPSDCWFAGDPLPAPQIGAFQLHWNGRSVMPEPYLPEGHTVSDMRLFEGRLYEGLQLLTSDLATRHLTPPPALRAINGEGSASVFEPILEPEEQKLLYGSKVPFSALGFLHLGTDENALWAAAGPTAPPSEEPPIAGVTVLRLSKIAYSSESHEYTEAGTAGWSQVLGPKTVPSGIEAFPQDVVNAIAAEPGTNSAWIALESQSGEAGTPAALVARISADGAITDEVNLPAGVEREHFGPKGAAARIVCPAAQDCWMATTQGWLLHLATEATRELPADDDPALALEEPIASRPLDQSLPQVTPDTIPVDDSGLEEEPPLGGGQAQALVAAPNQFATVPVPLLSHVHSRLVHGTTLELSFHLAVIARVRLLAKRAGKVIASTPTRTLKAGNRRLLLRLAVRHWPTKLDLETHALAPLPTSSTREAGTNVVATSLAFPGAAGLLGSGLLP